MKKIFYSIIAFILIVSQFPSKSAANDNASNLDTLVQLKEDLEVEEHFLIKRDTLLFVKVENDDTVYTNIFGKEIKLPLEIVDFEIENLENLPEYVEFDVKEYKLKKVEQLYGFPDGNLLIEDIDTNLPIVSLEDEKEIVIIGNAPFFLNKEDFYDFISKNGTEEIDESSVNEEENDDTPSEENSYEETTETELEIGEELTKTEKFTTNDSLIDTNPPNQSIQSKQLDAFQINSLSDSNIKDENPWGSGSGYFKVTKEGANVNDIRSGKHVAVGELVVGQVYYRVGKSGDYHKIRFGDFYGYVHMSRTEWSDGKEVKNLNNNRYKNTNNTFVAKNDIRVIDNSSGKFVTMGYIKKGTRFAIAENSSETFLRVIYADRVGYVYKSQVNVDFKDSDQYFVVTEEDAIVYDIRSGKYVPVGELVVGQAYPRVGKSGGYHKIRFGDYYGFVHMSRTNPTNGNSIKNKNTRYTNNGRTFTAQEDIRVIDNSSGEFVTMGYIKKDTEFAISQNSETDYWQVIYADRVGYVKKDLTRTSFKDSDKYFQVIKDAPIYDIRTGKYVKVGELAKGQYFPRIGTSGHYHRIQMGDFYGYVHRSNTVIGIDNNIKNEWKNEKNSDKTIIVSDNVNVIDNSSGKFVTMGTLEKGAELRIISESTTFAKIIFANRIGYVNKNNVYNKNVSYTHYDLTLEEALQIQMKAEPQTDKRVYAWVSKSYIDSNHRVTASSLNVRTQPSTKNSNENRIIGTLPKGTKVDVLYELDGWYAINYPTNSYNWIHAIDSDVLYYLNPNNFINHERYQFQFLDLSKPSGAPVSILNNFLSNKGILKGQGQAFINAARIHGVNDIYLLSHALLETGNGTSSLAQGIEVGLNAEGKAILVNANNRKSLRNIKKSYNVYGIGAYDSCPVSCGAIKAYEEGWDSVDKAIVGGAAFIGNSYIKAGLNTLYKMRWNPEAMVSTGRYGRQYATDIGWAVKQTTNMYNLYKEIGYDSPLLDIPVYKNK